jgi:hypothetical protein
MSFTLSRRTLLRGTGVALALPWLEAMQPLKAHGSGDAGAAGPPRRFAALYMPNGVRADTWTPEQDGFQWEPSQTLQPLNELRSDVSVLTGLWHKSTNTGDGHYVKTGGWLTGTTITKTAGVDLNSGGVSLDQLVASRIGDATPLPSLELGAEPVSKGVDGTVGYTRVYGAHVSWRSPTQPLAKEINPRLAFERMVRASSGGGTPQADRSLLDQVRQDASQLRTRLGSSDRYRIDEYLESVRALEQRLERAARPGGPAWKPLAPIDPAKAPTADPADHAERVRLMMDVIALAFETDSTRVCTFMFGNAVSGVNFSFLDGVSSGHHEVSHHQNEEGKLRQYERITRWHVEQYAYLLDRLRQIPEDDGNVLDNSLILFGSGLRDGNSHSPVNLPVLLGGRGGGRIRSGQHIRCEAKTPMSNLFVTMLDALGTPAERFADSTGPITELLV